MTISISIQIEPSQLKFPATIKLLQKTAEYLSKLAENSVPASTAVETQSGDVIEPTTSNEELDVDGKSWDYRLHSSTKAKNKDGRWKLKRNVDSKLEVISETGVTEQTDTPMPPPEDLLGKFMGKVTEKIVGGKMTHNALSAFLRENGIPDVPSIQHFPQLLPDLIKKIEVLA